MSLESVINAHSPIIYHRCDEVGTPSDGMEIADASGNGRHMELGYRNTSGTLMPLGRPSAVETDPASKALQCFFDSGSILSGDYSYAELPDEAALNVAGDFTLGCFVKAHTGLDLASTFPVYGKKGQYQITRKFNGSAGDVDFYYSGLVKLDNGTTYQVEGTLVPALEAFYFVAVVRFGTALSVYVNAQLRGTLTIPNLPNAADTEPFVIGGKTTADVRVDQDTEECFFVGEALTQGELQAIYDAARPYRDMLGRCNVVTSATLDGDQEPDPQALPFRHDWNAPLVERLAGRTSVFHSRDRTPELARQRTAPRREVEYSLAFKTEAERRLFRALASDAQGRRWYAGMWQYKTRVASQSAGATVFSLDTQYRDYDPGNHFMVWESEGKCEVVEIAEMDGSSLTGLTALTQSYTRPYVMPARRALLPPRAEMRVWTRNVTGPSFGRAGLAARLLAEDEPLSPNRVTPWTPTSEWDDFEVFAPAEWERNDYSEPVEIELQREVDGLDFGTGKFRERSPAAGPEDARTYRMLLHGLDKVAKFLGWWYYRRARAVPFWMPSFESDFAPVSFAGSTFTASGHGYTDHYEGAPNRDRVVFVYRDNSIGYRNVTGAAPSGANDQLTLTGGAGSMTTTNLRLACLLKLGHLDADTLELAWLTDDLVRVTWRFRELLAAPN